MTSSDQTPTWMTVAEVAEYLKLSRSKVYEMAQQGEIPCSKVAGQWRFHREEVDHWLFSQRQHQPRKESSEIGR